MLLSSVGVSNHIPTETKHPQKIKTKTTVEDQILCSLTKLYWYLIIYRRILLLFSFNNNAKFFNCTETSSVLAGSELVLLFKKKKRNSPFCFFVPVLPYREKSLLILATAFLHIMSSFPFEHHCQSARHPRTAFS